MLITQPCSLKFSDLYIGNRGVSFVFSRDYPQKTPKNNQFKIAFHLKISLLLQKNYFSGASLEFWSSIFSPVSATFFEDSEEF